MLADYLGNWFDAEYAVREALEKDWPLREVMEDREVCLRVLVEEIKNATK